MLGDGLANSGQKGSYFRYQYASLKLLEAILAGVTAIPGQDFETRTTTYTATANGIGYSIGDIIVRYDIINVATQTIVSTLWFNQTTQASIVPAPLPGDLAPFAAPTSVTVINGPGGAAVNIQDGGNSITIDAISLDVLLSTRASEATLATRASEATLATRASEATLATRATEATVAAILARLDVALSTRASAANQTTLGSQTTKINDGTNTAAVKAASTAPLATDPALVVTISPNSTIGITTSTTSTNTAVARATTVGGVTLLAANLSRKGATITNDSGAIMYVLFAVTGTVSSTAFTVRLGANDYYEVPFGYTGAISGIWASAGAGNALMSELT